MQLPEIFLARDGRREASAASALLAGGRWLLPALSALRLVGALAIELAVLWRFGLGPVTDQYFLAVAVPWLISRAVAAAAPAALVPALRASFANSLDPRRALIWLSIWSGLAALALGLIASAGFFLAVDGADVFALGFSLCVAHALSTTAELLKPALVASDRPVVSLSSDAWQALVAVTLVLAAPHGTRIQAIAWILALSFATQAAIVLHHVLRDAPLARFSLVEHQRLKVLWERVRKALLLTSGATSARRLSVPVERYVAMHGLSGAVSSIAYAGQATNALAAVMGASTTNWLLPALSDPAISTAHRRVIVARTCMWLAATGATVAGAIASVATWGTLIDSSPIALGRYASLAIATGITVTALPGMLVVQALLTVHYSQGDGVKPSNHLLFTLLIHLALLAALGPFFGVPGIAACWTLTGVISAVRATTLTAPLLGGRVFSVRELGMLSRRLGTVLSLQLSLTFVTGWLFGLVGAVVAVALVTGIALLWADRTAWLSLRSAGEIVE